MPRRPTPFLAVLLVLVLGVIAAPASAQTPGQPDLTPERLTDLTKPTSISAYRRWELFSRWDGSAYHLSVITPQDQVVDLDVPVQAAPFDADVGPDSSGTPSAVYSRCAPGCDLYVIGFGAGATPRPVQNANTSGSDEIAPAIDAGRLVFGRRYTKDKVLPYTKKLAAPRATPSTRLAGLPATRCGAISAPDCRPLQDVDLKQMDIQGRWVAQSWTYQPEDFPGNRQNEIRLTDTSRTDTRQIASMTTGESGQTYFGPAVAAGQVFFFRGCGGDPSGCHGGTSGVIRYGITAKSARIIAANKAWSGWAGDGTFDYHVPSDYDCAGGDPGTPPAEPCGIVRRFLGQAFEDIALDRLR